VACPTATFCMAVDGTGVYSFDGTTWSPAKTLGSGSSGPAAISCPTATFCVAVGMDGSAYNFNGSSWSTQSKLDVVNGVALGLDGVTCQSPSFCMAYSGENNRWMTYNGSVWSAPAMVGNGQGPKSVSCPTANLCVAVDGHDSTLTWHS